MDRIVLGRIAFCGAMLACSTIDNQMGAYADVPSASNAAPIKLPGAKDDGRVWLLCQASGTSDPGTPFAKELGELAVYVWKASTGQLWEYDFDYQRLKLQNDNPGFSVEKDDITIIVRKMQNGDVAGFKKINRLTLEYESNWNTAAHWQDFKGPCTKTNANKFPIRSKSQI
jgi:hypothetical protein